MNCKACIDNKTENILANLANLFINSELHRNQIYLILNLFKMKKLVLFCSFGLFVAFSASAQGTATGTSTPTPTTTAKPATTARPAQKAAPVSSPKPTTETAPVVMKDHVCTVACKDGAHVYAHGEKGHVCGDACKKMKSAKSTKMAPKKTTSSTPTTTTPPPTGTATDDSKSLKMKK